MGWPPISSPPHIPPPLSIPPEKTTTHTTNPGQQPKHQPQPNTKPSNSLQEQPSNLPLPHSKSQLLTQDLTKQPNTTHIDNKFFHFTLGWGRAYPYCITERKLKTTLGKIWLGLHDMVWLGNTIDMAAKVDMGGEFFRNHRDGYKAIHVLRRSNQHGLYLEVSEFHSGCRKGVIRIPAGLEQQGWVQFASMCKNYRNMQNPAKLPTNDRRKVAARGAVPNKAVEGAKPQILQKDRNFQNHVTAAVKKAVHSISIDSPSDTVNARVLLSLNLELSCGSDGNWVISKADLKQPDKMRPTPSRLPHNIIGSTSRPEKTTNKVWRPKAQTTQYASQTRDPKTSIPEVASGVEDPCGMETHFTAPTRDVASTSALTKGSDGDEASCSEIGEPSDAIWTFKIPEPTLEEPGIAEKNSEEAPRALTTLRRLGSDTSTEVQLSGDSAKWLLRLRDGRSIVLPAACFCGSVLEQRHEDGDQAIVATDGGMSSASSEGWYDGESRVDSLIEVFDSGEAHGLSKTGAGEQSPLCVEPIAVSYPLEMGNDHEYEESIPQQNEPSDWVQEKYQEF
ncbi:putative invertase inhibitor, partial [Fagus crenata]